MRLFLRTTKYYSVLKKYYSSTSLYYKVLLRTTLHYKVYSVLQSAPPVLLCTTQHYSVVQTTTPVLLCTTKYYSSTTLYYKVLNSSFYCESTSRKARVRNRMACVKKSQSVPIGACLRIVIYSLPSGAASFSKVIVKSKSSQRMGQVVVESKANVHIYIYNILYIYNIFDLFTCCTTKSAKFAALDSSTDAFDCKYSVKCVLSLDLQSRFRNEIISVLLCNAI